MYPFRTTLLDNAYCDLNMKTFRTLQKFKFADITILEIVHPKMKPQHFRMTNFRHFYTLPLRLFCNTVG